MLKGLCCSMMDAFMMMGFDDVDFDARCVNMNEYCTGVSWLFCTFL